MAGVTPNIRLNLPTYDVAGWDTLMNANLLILDSLVGRLSSIPSYGGIYAAGTTYAINTTVTDPADSSLWQNGVAYTTTVGNTFAQERAAFPGRWTNVTAVTTNAAASASLAAGSATTASAAQVAASASATAAAASQTAAATSATSASQSALTAGNNLGRNKIHNAQFNVSQRGAGPFTVNGAYTLDRWQLTFVLDTMSVAQVAITDVGRAAIGNESAQYLLANAFVGNAGATAFNAVLQKIENVRRLANKTITISFWANAVGTPKLGVSMAQVFGTGGSPSTLVQQAGQNVTLSSTWTRYQLTFTLPSVAGKTFGTTINTDYTSLQFWYSAGANSATAAGNIGIQTTSVNLWGIQLEVGSTATPFEEVDPRYDRSNCQRFFQVGEVDLWGYAAAGGLFGTSFPFVTQMRAAPTVTLSGMALQNLPSVAATTSSNASFYVAGTGTATAATAFTGSFIATADL